MVNFEDLGGNMGCKSESRENKKCVENMWVQSRLVEGRLVVLAVRGGTAPL
jgi:hypothetical protein